MRELIEEYGIYGLAIIGIFIFLGILIATLFHANGIFDVITSAFNQLR